MLEFKFREKLILSINDFEYIYYDLRKKKEINELVMCFIIIK